jgi:hypothetical protein
MSETGALTRLLSDALWGVADRLTGYPQTSAEMRGRRFGYKLRKLRPALSIRERIGYRVMDWSLRLYNPAGDIGAWPAEGGRRLLRDLDHPGGHINKTDCDAAESKG